MAKGVILILTQNYPPSVGGIETYIGDLAEAIYRAGWPVEVYSDAPQGSGGRAIPEGPILHRFTGLKPWRRRVKARRADERLRQGDIAAVFADSWKSIELISPDHPGIPVIVMAHGAEMPEQFAGHKAARVRRAFERASVIAANSRSTMALAAPFLPSGGKAQIVLPPVSDQPEPDPLLLKALNERIGPSRPLVVTLARLEPRKGIDALIRALDLLKTEFPGVRLAVAGGGEDRARLETIAAKCGVAGRVAFLGKITEAERAALFAAGDLFAMPSYRVGNSIEGFGKVYIEAAWAGLASVAGIDGGASDAVIDGETGLLCDGTSAASVAGALGQLLRDPALRARLAQRARWRAREELNWRVGASNFLALAGLAPSQAAPTANQKLNN